jgi:hypothetical protein
MLTLSADKRNQHILDMVPDKGKGKKKTPVYWHPVKNLELRNSVDDLNHFFSNEDFRDRFMLNKEEADDIKSCLSNEEVCDKYQAKFFKVKRFIQESLLNEMDISDTKSKFIIDFPKGGDTYGWCTFVCGGSGSGKTHWVVDRILRNLNGPKQDRRTFIYCSAELELDKTLIPVRDNKKYKDSFIGVDISEEAVKSAYETSPQEFFENRVQMVVDTAPAGSILVADDAQDSHPVIAEKMRKLIVRVQRVGRHRKLGLMFLLHKLKSGSWSSQAYSSCRHIVVFPRSQKNKIRDMLEVDFGIPKKEARRTVADFGQTGRAMILHAHSPNYIVNDKLLRLI